MKGNFEYNPEHWENEVKRYLYARLDSLWKDLPGNENEIINFLETLTLSSDDLEWVALLYHLLRTDGAQQFLIEELPDQLSSLSRIKESRQIRDRKPRGRILWEKTILEQRRRHDYHFFVYDSPSKTPNTPENMLLKLYIEEVAKRSRLYKGQHANDAHFLHKILMSCEEILMSTYMKDITIPAEASWRMILRASRDRRKIYAHLHELWVEYEKAVLQRDLETLKSMLSFGWLAPLAENNLDRLFELFVLISIINSVEEFIFSNSSSIKKSKFGLVRKNGSRVVAVIEGDKWIGEIGFNKTPEKVFNMDEAGSLYRTILSLYEGISGISRRPDISVRITTPGSYNEIRLIVEVKNTTPESIYGNDSLYKALGYLKDFESIWQATNYKPKIVLVFPSGTRPNTTTEEWLDQDIAIISGDISNWFLKILENLAEKI